MRAAHEQVRWFMVLSGSEERVRTTKVRRRALANSQTSNNTACGRCYQAAHAAPNEPQLRQSRSVSRSDLLRGCEPICNDITQRRPLRNRQFKRRRNAKHLSLLRLGATPFKVPRYCFSRNCFTLARKQCFQSFADTFVLLGRPALPEDWQYCRAKPNPPAVAPLSLHDDIPDVMSNRSGFRRGKIALSNRAGR